MMFIQPPDRNTQLLSHIHCFLLDPSEPLPKALEDNYISVELIQEVKQELESGAEEDDCELTRTATPPIQKEDFEEEAGMGLTRQMSSVPKVSVA